MRKGNKIISILFVFFAAIILVACGGGGSSEIDANKIEEFVNKVLEEINLPTNTMGNINLPRNLTVEDNEVRISWLSSNSKVISSQGIVNRPDYDETVNLTAIISANYIGGTVSKVIEVKVIGVDSNVFPNSNYESDYGFAWMSITNRDIASVEEIEVGTEIEFIETMYYKYQNPNKNLVIKITADLNMGARHVRRLMEAAGKTENEINTLFDGKVYREHANHPLLHPTLIENGVGHLIIQVPNLMIYSETGIKIEHMSTHIKDASNIVIRNLHLTGIWEWDETSRGDYDTNDWDYFTIERTEGVWLDHLQTNASYDGLVDIKKDTKNITISYHYANGTPDEFIEVQINELERRYQEGDVLIPYYTSIRNSGVSVDTLIRATATIKKGFNFGNTTAGTDFEMITVTIHHSYFKNLQDRIPRLRKGDVHLYNVVIDSEDIRLIRSELSEVAYNVISQALVPTEQGAVLMENSRLIGVNEPIKTHQEGVIDPMYTGRYFVKDSLYEYYNEQGYQTYYGSTGDLLSKWEQSNTNVPKLEDFYFRNYQVIPYKYKETMVSAHELRKALLENGVGSGSIENLNWLKIRPLLSDPGQLPQSHKIDGDSIVLDEALVDVHNNNFVALNPLVRNFYPGVNFELGKDYLLDVDLSGVDFTKPGKYVAVYTFSSLVHEDDVVIKYQDIMVYDGEAANEIFQYTLTNEFNSEVSLNYRTYRPYGTLYYLLTDENNLALNEILDLAEMLEITSTNSSEKFDTMRKSYLYLVTLKEENGVELYSEVIKIAINKEQIVEIRTGVEVNRMITDVRSQGKYYVLMNDIDLSDTVMGTLNTQTVFSGVFDGQNFTLSGLGDEDTYRTRGGLFHTITNGLIKNLVIDDFLMQVGTRYVPNSENPNIIEEIKPAADGGILATYIYQYGRIENVVIKNSTLRTNQNYGAALLGRLRTGIAEISQVSLYNVSIINYEATEYSAGFIGSSEANTILFYNDIYAENLLVEHTDENSNMIGGIGARIRSYIYVENVVFYNVNLKGPHNLGIAFGKEDSGAYDKAYVKNAFMNAHIHQMRRGNGEFSSMFGYAVGNHDFGVFYVDNYFATETNVATGYPRVTIPSTGSAGIGEPFAPLAENFLDTVNESWWQENLPELYNSANWVVVNGRIMPTNHIHFN